MHCEHKNCERGFSLLEVLVAMFVMLIVTGAIFALMRDSMKTSTAALELSDGQQSVRTAQEYINRDLINAGDGLNSISNISVPENFVRNYLTLNPVVDPPPPTVGFVKLGLLTSDNNVLPRHRRPGHGARRGRSLGAVAHRPNFNPANGANGDLHANHPGRKRHRSRHRFDRCFDRGHQPLRRR